jgi:hypothetical protein
MTGEVITALTVVGALALLGSGYYRARPYGRLGLFSWLQSVALMAPWLIFFGLAASGLYLNIVGVLLLLLGATVIYILLGRTVRSLAQAELAKQALTQPPEQPAEPLAAIDQTTKNEPTAATPTVTIAGIPATDLASIRGIFGLDTFFATETVPYQDGVIFNGNLRGEPAVAHAKLSATLKERMGDRYRLFLVENLENKPTIVVLPKSADPATIATCLETASFLLGFDFYQTPQRIAEVLPIASGIVAILAVHELGHWWMARHHDIKLSWPFFLPTWQIGAFGALTQFESLLPSRKVLFDIAFAGPAAGGVLSLILLLSGLLLSHGDSGFQLPTPFFEGSILVGTLAKVTLGEALKQSLVAVHPLVIVGWIGLIITAINLMPAGRLDGGRIVQAIYGRKIANRTTIITLVLLTIVSLVNPLAMYWAILILFLQRNLERPSLDEITEPDDARAALALVALFLMVAILLPLSPGLAGRLGIGT